MKNYLEDIKFLLNKLEELHPCLYYNANKNTIINYVDKIKSSEIKNDLQFYYHIKRILKIVDGKVLVIGTSSEYENILHYELIAINGFSIENIIKELEKTISYTAIGHLESEVEVDLLRGSSILSLPIFNDKSDIISYTFKNNNNIEKIELNCTDNFNYDFLEQRPYWLEYDANTNILIIKYRVCRESKNKTMLEFIAEIDDLVVKRNISNVIVDLRGNTGGHSGIIEPLVKFLNDKKFNLITLIDSGVYSSGCWAVLDLQSIGSKFVGTELGTTINHFGYVENFELPHTKVRIGCSIRYWYHEKDKMKGLDKNNFEEFYNNPNNNKYFSCTNFEPDVYVKNSYEDYLNDIDRELDVAKKQLMSIEFGIAKEK